MATLTLSAVSIRSFFATDLLWFQIGRPGTPDQKYPGAGIFREATRISVTTGRGGMIVGSKSWRRYEEAFILIARGPWFHTAGPPAYPTWSTHARLTSDTHSRPDEQRGWKWLGWATAATTGILPVAEKPNANLPREPSRPNLYFMTFRDQTTHLVVPLPLLIVCLGACPAWRFSRRRRMAGPGFPIALAQPVQLATSDAESHA